MVDDCVTIKNLINLIREINFNFHISQLVSMCVCVSVATQGVTKFWYVLYFVRLCSLLVHVTFRLHLVVVAISVCSR